MTIKEFLDIMKRRDFMDHKDVQIALRTDEWGSGSYDDWRELFINFVRKDNIPQTIEDIKEEIRKFRESKGYQEDPSMKYFIQGLTKGDESLLYNVHTSGHADVSTLKRLVSQLNPEKVIPIHTFRPEMYKELFNNVVEIADGQEIEI